MSAIYFRKGHLNLTLAALFSKTNLLSLRELKAEVKAELTVKKWYPRQGSNLRPFAPEANALIH